MMSKVYSKMDFFTLKIAEFLGTEICISQSDGEKVFKEIYSRFQRNERVNLSFANVKFLISAFLNPSLGMLYKYYTPEYLNENLKLSEIAPSQMAMVKEVLRNAKEYYNDQQKAMRDLEDAEESI